MWPFRVRGDHFYAVPGLPGLSLPFNQVPIHLAQLRVVLDDGGIRALPQDDLRSFGVRFPVCLIMQLVEPLHGLVQAHGDRLETILETSAACTADRARRFEFFAAP